MLVALAALAVASPVGLQISAGDDLTAADRADLLEAASSALEGASGRAVRLDSRPAPACADRADCEAAARAGLGVDTLVRLQVVRGVTLLRVKARRFGGPAAPPTQVDLPAKEPSAWPAALEGLFRGLFLEPLAAAPSDAPLTASGLPPEREARVTPWIAFGVAAVALGVGVGLGASSRGARGAAETAPDLQTYEAEADDAQRLGWAANAMFGVAGAAALTGGLLWWLD